MKCARLSWMGISSSCRLVSSLRSVFAFFILTTYTAHCTDAHVLVKCISSIDCSHSHGYNETWSCCDGVCLKGVGCTKKRCNINSDCSTAEVCCAKTCHQGRNCSDRTCSFDTDCQWYETCCFGSCQMTGDCVNITAVVISASAIVLVLFVAICFCLCRPIFSGSNIYDTSSRSFTSSTLILVPEGTVNNPPTVSSAHEPQAQMNSSLDGLLGRSTTEMPPPYSERERYESTGAHSPISSYGSTEERLQALQ